MVDFRKLMNKDTMIDLNDWLDAIAKAFTGYEAKNASGRGFDIPNSFFCPNETRGDSVFGDLRESYDLIEAFYRLITDGLDFGSNNSLWAKFTAGTNVVEACYSPCAYWIEGHLTIRWGQVDIPVNIGTVEGDDYIVNTSLTLSQSGYPNILFTMMRGDDICLTYICPIRVKQGSVSNETAQQWLQATTAPKAKKSLSFLAENVSPPPMQGVYVSLKDLPLNQPMEIVDYKLSERSGQGWTKVYCDVCTKNSEIFSITGKASEMVQAIDKVDKKLIESATITLTGLKEMSKARDGVMGNWSLYAPKYTAYITESIGALVFDEVIDIKPLPESDKDSIMPF